MQAGASDSVAPVPADRQGQPLRSRRTVLLFVAVRPLTLAEPLPETFNSAQGLRREMRRHMLVLALLGGTLVRIRRSQRDSTAASPKLHIKHWEVIGLNMLSFSGIVRF